MTQASKGTRRGSNFTVRITDEERAKLSLLQRDDRGPRKLGPWLVWRALDGESPAVPRQVGLNFEGSAVANAAAMPELTPAALPPRASRVVLDLCGGSGSWGRPYREAGYDVRLVTWPENDVRLYVPPPNVWGVLAAPPCTKFSTASPKPAAQRLADGDFVEGMECVNACMRIVLQCRPRWWALENPKGHLSKFLGTARDVWEPCDFGDPHTKRTCIWGDFALPKRGPFVEPLSGMPAATCAI